MTVNNKNERKLASLNKKVVQTEQRKTSEKGFTLIELSMALLFLSFIMLFLISTLIMIMRTYNKGVWVSQINQAARQINADIGDSARFTKGSRYEEDHNRLCVGGVSYLWNMNEGKGSDVVNWYKPQEGSTKPSETSLRLVRVKDSNGRFCSNTDLMPDRADSNVSNLLSSGVIVQQFEVTNASNDSNSRLINIKTVFSTGGVNRPQFTDGHWQCGDTVAGGGFVGGANQYCAFIDLNMTVFGRNSQ